MPLAHPPSPADPPGEEERYGPLAVRRFRKDDGRALILYEARDDEPDRDDRERTPVQRASR
jgi:hypothetical protein